MRVPDVERYPHNIGCRSDVAPNQTYAYYSDSGEHTSASFNPTNRHVWGKSTRTILVQGLLDNRLKIMAKDCRVMALRPGLSFI